MHRIPIIVVVGMMRSGTTVFRRLLELAGASDLGETFALPEPRHDVTHSFFHYVRYRASHDFKMVHPDNYPVLFTDFLEERSELPVPLLIDIKIRQSSVFDFGHPFGAMAVFDFLTKKNASFVRVVRRNLLRSRISHEIALRNGAWALSKSQSRTGPRPVSLEVKWLLDLLNEDRMLQDQVDRKIPAARLIYYEDMFTPGEAVTEGTAALISQLVGRPIEPSHLSASLDLQKQNPEPVSALLYNYDEVCAALRGTDFEWMVHD